MSHDSKNIEQFIEPSLHPTLVEHNLRDSRLKSQANSKSTSAEGLPFIQERLAARRRMIQDLEANPALAESIDYFWRSMARKESNRLRKLKQRARKRAPKTFGRNKRK